MESCRRTAAVLDIEVDTVPPEGQSWGRSKSHSYFIQSEAKSQIEDVSKTAWLQGLLGFPTCSGRPFSPVWRAKSHKQRSEGFWSLAGLSRGPFEPDFLAAGYDTNGSIRISQHFQDRSARLPGGADRKANRARYVGVRHDFPPGRPNRSFGRSADSSCPALITGTSEQARGVYSTLPWPQEGPPLQLSMVSGRPARPGRPTLPANRPPRRGRPARQ